MSTDRDVDRIVRSWLEEGVTSLPDRVLDNVLDQLPATPQRRSRLAAWRLNTMATPIRLAATAAAIGVLAVVVGIAPRTTGPGNPNLVASPSPSPSPSPSAAPFADLVSLWMAALPVGSITADADGTVGYMNLDASGYWVRASSGDNVQNSSQSVPEPGRLVLRSTDSTGGCTVGDEGSYQWSLTPGGTRLTLELDAEACAARGTVLAREWLRIACTDFSQGTCLGDVEAGTYPSSKFQPEVPAGGPPVHSLGALTYTVPAGWANSTDLPGRLILKPQTAYAQYGADWSDEIDVFAKPAAATNSTSCQWMVPASGVGSSADALLEWVTKQPGIVATAPQAITIDGHAGKWVDLSVGPGATATCPGDSFPSVGLYSGALNPGDAGPQYKYSWGIGNDRERHIFLDLPGGETMVIVVPTRNNDQFDTFVAQAMPIIQSFDFTP